MKNSKTLIIGATGLLLAITMSSCSTAGKNSAAPAEEKQAQATTETSPKEAPGVSATQVSLMDAFNQTGIYADGVQFSGGIDNDGFACSSNLLGEAQTWNSVKFSIGSANGSNVISCAGQTIPLPSGTFSKLEMLGIAVNGAQESQNFTVTYTDPSLNKGITQNLSDWASPDSNDGESQAVTMAYRIQSDGTHDDNSYYLYSYSFNLDKKGTVQGLKLPDNQNVKVFAVTLLP